MKFSEASISIDLGCSMKYSFTKRAEVTISNDFSDAVSLHVNVADRHDEILSLGFFDYPHGHIRIEMNISEAKRFIKELKERLEEIEEEKRYRDEEDKKWIGKEKGTQ